MNNFAALVFVFTLCLTSIVSAKRTPPPQVGPVRSGDVEFRAPADQMGCVEAWDTKHNEIIWRRQVYVVRFTAGLERDVQDVFIKSMVLKDKVLVIVNERNSEYGLNLDSLEVVVNKGNLVENGK
jgi:hypothetical protein